MLLLDDLDTEALLLLAGLLRETLLFNALLRDTPLFELPFRNTPPFDETLLLLEEFPMLRDTLLFDALLRDTLLFEELLRLDDALLLFEKLLLLREPATEAEPLRELLDELLRDTLPFEAALREEELGIIALRRLSSEFTFTTRLSLSREGTLTSPDLRSRLLFS